MGRKHDILTDMSTAVFCTKKSTTKTGKKKNTKKQKECKQKSTTDALTIKRQTPKTAGQKERWTHETRPNNTSNKHGQHNTENINMILSFEQRKKTKKKHRTKENHQGIIFTMPKQHVQPGERLSKRLKTGRANNANTQQKRARKIATRKTHQTWKKEEKNTGKKCRTDI